MRPSSCLLASVLVAGFLAAGARPAAACSCAGSLSPCQAFATSPIVFVGEVVSVEQIGGDFHMRLRVVRALKGIEDCDRRPLVQRDLMTRAMAANGAAFAEFDETGDGPVRTLKLVRDQAYTLLVSMFIPAGPERPWHGERREEKLPPTDLPAGAPGRHIALVAPFANCAETAR